MFLGSYDARTPLHLACAGAKVMAVTFLLSNSACVNIKDRWGATPMDDCVRGETLYHLYCAKLMQCWGGSLGVFLETPEGDQLLEKLGQVCRLS